ncbi:MAG: bifunctional 3,4-dihydroxy-2-butanone-4-phosphate synthase/GTP cyclohydrolase II [Chloroflexi bacterium]|nr:bifunctional 3,4-dihydroxy-2-butanone-4-phosphate synthase/GTP cyclohydrolase II [Chloroflexota bacterium]
MALVTIEEAIEDFRAGKFVIIVEDEDRENEGDLAIAAEKVTPEAINFMAKYGRGLICMPTIGQRLDELKVPMMVQEQDNSSPYGTAFTVSVEAKHGVSTGISAYDRAATVRAILDPRTRPEDLSRPGHMFPLRAREGGVLVRAGQTEGAVDLSRLAGLYPAAVICEVMNDDGTMARMPQLQAFSERHGVRIISVAQLIEYRRRHEKLVKRIAETLVPSEYGNFKAIAYEDIINRKYHVAFVLGEVTTGGPVLVRVHSECLTGDVFGSNRCDCGHQLRRALEIIRDERRGVVLYLRQEGRGIGLHNKLRAYELQDAGLDTVEANIRLGFPPDLREYGIGAQILVDLGLQEIRVMTNNPKKLVGLRGYGLTLAERVPLTVPVTPENARYLETKRAKLGHLVHMEEEADAATL